MTLEVYENGDAYVSYGEHSQWFPFKTAVASRGISLLSEAYAQEVRSIPQPSGRYQQAENLESGVVTRTRTFENQVKEVIRIDRNSGNIIGRSVEHADQPSTAATDRNAVRKVQPVVIDVEGIRRSRVE